MATTRCGQWAPSTPSSPSECGWARGGCLRGREGGGRAGVAPICLLASPAHPCPPSCLRAFLRACLPACPSAFQSACLPPCLPPCLPAASTLPMPTCTTSPLPSSPRTLSSQTAGAMTSTSTCTAEVGQPAVGASPRPPARLPACLPALPPARPPASWQNAVWACFHLPTSSRSLTAVAASLLHPATAAGPHNNLVSNVNLGRGSRAFHSGGDEDRGAYAGGWVGGGMHPAGPVVRSCACCMPSGALVARKPSIHTRLLPLPHPCSPAFPTRSRQQHLVERGAS